MNKLYLGTAGWSYKDWVPNFYPRGQSKNFDWLQFYSQYFNVVEVNATYYAYLARKTFEGWAEKLEGAEDFCFTIKLHQDFTHARKFTDEQVQAVTGNLDVLDKAGRLGGLLIQFPYSFSFNDAAVEHVRMLNEIFGQYRRFVEVRHSSWNNPEAYSFFREMDIGICTIDQPQIGNSVPFEPLVTNNQAYFRFHGRNAAEWFKSVRNYGKEQTYEQASERYKYLYSPGELVEIDRKIREVFDRVRDVYVIMNNHPSSYGIVNAFELLHMLSGREKVKMPEWTAQAFPRLQRISA